MYVFLPYYIHFSFSYGKNSTFLYIYATNLEFRKVKLFPKMTPFSNVKNNYTSEWNHGGALIMSTFYPLQSPFISLLMTQSLTIKYELLI